VDCYQKKIDQFFKVNLIRHCAHCSVELHPYNIRVSVIEPGAHATNFLGSIKNYVTAAWDQLSTETKDKFGMEYLQKGGLLTPS